TRRGNRRDTESPHHGTRPRRSRPRRSRSRGARAGWIGRPQSGPRPAFGSDREDWEWSWAPRPCRDWSTFWRGGLLLSLLGLGRGVRDGLEVYADGFVDDRDVLDRTRVEGDGDDASAGVVHGRARALPFLRRNLVVRARLPLGEELPNAIPAQRVGRILGRRRVERSE